MEFLSAMLERTRRVFFTATWGVYRAVQTQKRRGNHFSHESFLSLVLICMSDCFI
jgi:hypothetical protein